MHYRFAILIATLCGPWGFAQTSAPSASGITRPGSMHFGEPEQHVLRSVVTGAPYSAERTGEHIQILADGTRTTQKQVSTKVYRDAAGRIRSERPINSNDADSPMIVEITDPVAKVKFILDPFAKVAHRQQLPALPDRAGKPIVRSGTESSTSTPSLTHHAAPDAARPEFADEKLGTQTMEGVLVEGSRHTAVWPVGSQGNDHPITVVNETWRSPELKIMVMSSYNDPRSGEQVQKMTNIVSGDPAASLFEPPSDYAVVDEPGEFTIKWGSQ